MPELLLQRRLINIGGVYVCLFVCLNGDTQQNTKVGNAKKKKKKKKEKSPSYF